MKKLIFSIVFVTQSLWAIPFEGHKIAMSGPSPQAVEAGRKVAEMGGNVADVTVAMGLVMAVTGPYFASFGGGGFALVKFDGKVRALDFRETAPKAMSPTYYLDKAKNASTVGGTAVGVPGFLAGLWEIHQRYGKLSWKKLFAVPMELAEDGFQVSGEWVRNTARAKKDFNKWGKEYFLNDGKDYLPGEKLEQPKLFKALKLIKSKGAQPFYDGDISKDLVATIKETGGHMALSDLKEYRVRWLDPLKADFAGHKIYLMPPPSSGGIVIQSSLALMEKLNLKKYKAFSVDELHLMGEIMSRSFRGRMLLGDPDFHKNPLTKLVEKSYLKKLAKSISLKKTKNLEPLKESQWKESTETTHYTVMDAEGNAITLTVTLNGNYGSKVVTKEFGIALNNEMDDFTTRPGEPNMFGLVQGNGNKVEPGKRPLSSMSPTLVEKDGKTVLALGGRGGPKIINGVLQVMYRTLVTGYDMDQAIQAPRIHHQFLPRKLFVNKNQFFPETLSGLRKRGHTVEESWTSKIYGVRKNGKGFLEAAFDHRAEGAVGGF